jgi:hypothetical protein
MYKPHIRCYFFHHFILKVTTMISENITGDTEPSDNLIDTKKVVVFPSDLTVGMDLNHLVN